MTLTYDFQKFLKIFEIQVKPSQNDAKSEVEQANKKVLYIGLNLIFS